jgi:hypothetical protein
LFIDNVPAVCVLTAQPTDLRSLTLTSHHQRNMAYQGSRKRGRDDDDDDDEASYGGVVMETVPGTKVGNGCPSRSISKRSRGLLLTVSK